MARRTNIPNTVGPFTVAHSECQDTRRKALKREAAIQAMPREENLGLIGTDKTIACTLPLLLFLHHHHLLPLRRAWQSGEDGCPIGNVGSDGGL